MKHLSWEEFERRCVAAGCKAVRHTDAHWQVHGPANIVDVYPRQCSTGGGWRRSNSPPGMMRQWDQEGLYGPIRTALGKSIIQDPPPAERYPTKSLSLPVEIDPSALPEHPMSLAPAPRWDPSLAEILAQLERCRRDIGILADQVRSPGGHGAAIHRSLAMLWAAVLTLRDRVQPEPTWTTPPENEDVTYADIVAAVENRPLAKSYR